MKLLNKSVKKGGRYHGFEQFFYNFLCLSESYVNNAGR
jgi:hypothetical protein